MLRSRSRRRPLGAVFLVLTLMVTLFNTTVPAHADDVGSFTVFIDPAIGNAGELTPRSFTFDYECSNTAGEPTVSGVLTVEVGSGVTITDVPIGQCDAYQRDASVPGADLVSATVVSNQDVIWEDIAGAEFDVTGGRDTRITVWNVYSRHGTFEVSKVIEGIGDQSVGPYVFTYTCTDGQSGSLTVSGDGMPVTADTTFPRGTECTVSEDVSSAQVPGYSIAVPQAQTVKIRNGTSQRLSFTNAYTRDEGAFIVSKEVTGDYQVLDSDVFTVDYECDNGAQGSIEVPGNGAEVLSPRLQAGIVCTITEDAASAERAGYELSTTYSTQSLQLSPGAALVLTVTNHYTAHRGSFSVTKSVSGALAGDREFVFGYDCSDGQAGSLTVKGDGVAVNAAGSFPAGTECTISEDVDAAQIDGYTLDAPQTRTVTIPEGDQVVPVDFVNAYTPAATQSPSAPEESPESPEPTSSAPEESPESPEPTSSAPEENPSTPEPSAPAPTQTPSAPVETPKSSAPVPNSSPSESARRSSVSPSGLPRTGSGVAGLTAVAAAGALAALPLLRRRRR